MKKLFFILLCMSFCIISFSQYEYVNCIIIIDGKLPIGTIGGCIIYNDITKERNIDFICIPGQIMIETKAMNVLNVLPDTTTLTIHINHTEFYKYQQRKIYNYTTTLSLKLLRQKKNYLIFNITNLKKEKGIYYFDYLSSGEMKKWQWKKEYGNRKRSYKKIRSVLPDIYPQ